MKTSPSRSPARAQRSVRFVKPDASDPEKGGNIASDLESEETFSSLFETSPCALVVLDETGTIQRANESFWTLVGYKKAPTSPMMFSSFVERSNLADYLRHLRECRGSKKVARVEFFLRRPEGWFPVRVLTRTQREPDVYFHCCIIEDADRQGAIKESERKDKAHFDFIDSMDGIVWEMDAESGQTTYVSRGAERLLGFPANAWSQGNEFRERHLFMEDRERVLNQFARALIRRENFVVEYRLIAADRSLVWLRDAVTVGELEGRLKFRGVAVNITDRKNAEERAERAAEELERRVRERTSELQWTVSELESFSYTLSHDMRAPLRAIQGYAQIIAENVAQVRNAETVDFLSRIMRSASRLDALVLDVLKYGRMAKTEIKLSAVDLNGLISSLVEASPELQEPMADVKMAPKLSSVLGHEGFLTQCLSNLLSNARKFAKPGCAPRIKIWTQPQKDGHVLLWVEDDGIGIAPEDHLRIFKVFERCHSNLEIEGTGIGLAIVQRAVQRMDGMVGVESLPGGGSKFWIKLLKG